MSNKLPSAYQEVEYIYNNGKQYIRLDITGTKNMKIHTKFMITNINGATIYGNDGLSNIDDYGFRLFFLPSKSKLYAASGNSRLENLCYNIKTNTIYESIHYKNKVTIDNVNYNSGYGDYFNYNIRLMSNSHNSSYKFIGNFYYCRIYDNDNIIRDLIPVKRKNDDEIGLYDLITNTFYTNSGTGNFIAGPEVIEEKEIIKKPEVNWSDSMEQTFEYYEVDPVSWKDTKPLDMVKKSTIKRDDGADTLGSATIDINDTLGECYIRIYLIIRQNGAKFKITLGTFLVQTPSSSYDGKNRNVSMDAYTPLLELKENPPPLGFALLKNENIMKQAYMLIKDNCRAPVVETTSDKTLQDNFVADPSEKWLNYINDLIAQAKYRLYLDEEGRILFAPIQKIDELQPVWTYNDNNSSILYPEVSMQHDLYGIPNVVEVVCSTGVKEYTARVVNDDPNSPTSTVNRGREILHRDTEPNLPGFPTEEQIDEYAKHLLETLSSVEYQVSYTHGYCPVRVGDAVRLNYKKAGLDNIKAKVISQSIKCENGCSVNETAVFTKKLWN